MANEMRLIDANAFLEHWNKEYRHRFPCDMYKVAIANFPTVDAAPVVHGRWEKTEYYGWIRCDKCKDVYIEEGYLGNGKWNYCPNCGAKMDGGDGDV